MFDCPSCALERYRTRQRDACQYAHSGPKSATDDSVDLKGERLGTSFVVVEKPRSDIILELTAPVGGPLATLRAEAVGVLWLLLRVKSHFHHAVPLLVIFDCLVLLLLLQKWDILILAGPTKRSSLRCSLFHSSKKYVIAVSS